MKQVLNKNPYKFKLFRSHPVASIITTVVILAVCYFVGVGRFSIGSVRLQTPNSISADFVCFIGHIEKTFNLSEGVYMLDIEDDLSSGDLHYRLLLDSKEVFTTDSPTSVALNGMMANTRW